MNRSKRVLISLGVLTLLVVTIAFAASVVIKPNQATPIKNILPARESSVELPSDKVIAAWIWQYPTELKENFEAMLDFAKKEEINTIYLYIDEYIDIYELEENEEKKEKLDNYLNAVREIIAGANQRNIAVHALSGYPAYSYDSHEYIPPIIINHVYEFNSQNPDTKFEGIQFDIEFYDDPRFFGSTKEYTDGFLGLVDRLVAQTVELSSQTGQNLKLGFVIPFWFDEPNEYFGDPILPNILSSLAKSPDSYLVIMAYRNVVDDVIKISENELASGKDTGVGIIIAQEIVRNDDEKITHFGKSRDEMKSDFSEIIQKASGYPSFKGISIHDLTAFTETL